MGKEAYSNALLQNTELTALFSGYSDKSAYITLISIPYNSIFYKAS